MKSAVGTLVLVAALVLTAALHACLAPHPRLASQIVRGRTALVPRTHIHNQGLRRRCERGAQLGRSLRIRATEGAEAGEQTLAMEPEITSDATTPKLPISDEWQLDVYNRPVVNGGKKLWELMICDKTGGWRFLETLDQGKINSKEIRRVLEKAMKEAPRKPTSVRYFRKQAVSIIRKALEKFEKEDNVRPIKSRATYALFDWLQERYDKVYPMMEGYQPPKQSGKDFAFTRKSVSPPTYVEGEDWSFSEVRLSEIITNTQGMTESGRVCPIPEDLSPDTFVPGLVIYSPRAKALSVALMGTVIEAGDISSVSIDTERSEVVYDMGVEEKWKVGKLDDDRLVREARAFEEKKKQLGGLHFLAVHQLPQYSVIDLLFNRKKELGDEEIEGFWLFRQGNYGWEVLGRKS
uniref:Uncharacterized protein n=1 Tax=Lotharella oceanica TaxID=641309 RepID=A0A7S2TVR1_9EUKA